MLSKVIHLVLLYFFCQQSTAAEANWDSPYYAAGVVEFSKYRNSDYPILETKINLQSYLNLIYSTESDGLDILVFPESTLNNHDTAEFIPEPEEKIIACDTNAYENVIKNISCAARATKKYVVINLTEKSICPDKQQIEFNDSRPCSDDKINKYNTNVVFDRDGRVISKYRKFNLYGELGVIQPLFPQSIPFTTDFNVTFGQIICFDILFYSPTMDLVKQGVRDFIYPTMWFSKAPFLTASQIQQGWAYANNVNLLAAGASDPSRGSTGTGIYHGIKGFLVSVMSAYAKSKIYRTLIPKMTNTPAEPPIISPPERSSSNDMLNLFLKRDNAIPFETFLLTNDMDVVGKLMCHGSLCCNFQLNVTFEKPSQNQKKVSYHYRLMAYDGLRTYKRESVRICAVIVCSTLDVDSCALRHNNHLDVEYLATFNNITIETDFFEKKNILIMPSTLDFSILPYNVSDVKLRDEKIFDGRHVEMRLLTRKSDLFSFGIYVRNYDDDRSLFI